MLCSHVAVALMERQKHEAKAVVFFNLVEYQPVSAHFKLIHSKYFML